MPFAEIKATTAKVGLFTKVQKIQIAYTISTPASDDAPTFDPALPSIVFLHPTYVPQEFFHLQFSDAGLRSKYNLIAMDSRGHGRTKGTLDQGFKGLEDASDDVVKFMDAIKLPTAHIMGASYGANIGIWAAIRNRSRVLSLMLISPLPQVEPKDVAEGRWETLQCWSDGVLGSDSDGMAMAAKGAVQITFDGDDSVIAHSMIMNAAFPACIRNWHGGEKGVKIAKKVAGFDIIDRTPLQVTDFAKLEGMPVFICAGDKDLLYPPPTEMRNMMKQANIVAELEVIHNSSSSCNVTGSERFNHFYRNFLASNFPTTATPSIAPAPGFKIASPYQDVLFPKGTSFGAHLDEEDSE